jgi:hypothetical protein
MLKPINRKKLQQVKREISSQERYQNISEDVLEEIIIKGNYNLNDIYNKLDFIQTSESHSHLIPPSFSSNSIEKSSYPVQITDPSLSKGALKILQLRNFGNILPNYKIETKDNKINVSFDHETPRKVIYPPPQNSEDAFIKSLTGYFNLQLTQPNDEQNKSGYVKKTSIRSKRKKK